MQFNFTYDWQDRPDGIRLDSHGATWADLKLGIDDRFFTANEVAPGSATERVKRNYVSVSVFPLAEFFAANWWALLNEPFEKKDVPNTDIFAFDRRHWIDQHTDGFSYPKLGFFGADSSIRLCAKPTILHSSDIHFTERTRSTNSHLQGLPRDVIEAKLFAFVQAVADRLPDNDDRGWLLDQLSRIDNSRQDVEEAKYCRYAGLLGEDPYESGDVLFSVISKTVELLGEEVASEMCATSEVNDVLARASWVHEQSAAICKRSASAAEHSLGLKKELAGHGASVAPWQKGYSSARKLRHVLGIPADQALDADKSVSQHLFDLDEDLIVKAPGLEIASGARGVLVNDARGLGLTLEADRRRPAKFQTAAIFSDFIFSSEKSLCLTTRASTDRQKCNRAFAAELLAPVEGIREHWLAWRSPSENYKRISSELNVTQGMVYYQVINQAPELLTHG